MSEGEQHARDQHWMRYALALASKAVQAGEVPVGAVLVLDNEAVGEGWNQPISSHDPSAHAEVMALRAAGKHMGNYRLPGATLYVTLEPCQMCAGAMVHARVQRLVFGAADPKTGAAGSVLNAFAGRHINHQVILEGGVMQEECSKLLKHFFQSRR